MINEYRKWAAIALEGLDGVAAALIIGVSTGSLQFSGGDETQRP
jgi:hypothetical protein